MKTAVVTDSNSGITQKEAEELGVFVIPMPFMIDGNTYEEDISLTQGEFYERLKEDADISTSQPSPETVLTLWDEILKVTGFFFPFLKFIYLFIYLFIGFSGQGFSV